MSIFSNTTYFTDIDLDQTDDLLDNPKQYSNNMFHVTKANLLDNSEPIWYLCGLYLVTSDNYTRYVFVTIIDNNMTSVLKNVQIIDFQYVESFMLYDWKTIGNPKDDQLLKNYDLSLASFMDLSERTNEKDGTTKITVYIDNKEKTLLTRDWMELFVY